MNFDRSKHAWSRLTAAARQVPREEDTTAAYGFATRVTALAFSAEPRKVSFYERFALRAVGTACVLAGLSVAANFSVMRIDQDSTESVLEDYDPVAVLMDGDA